MFSMKIPYMLDQPVFYDIILMKFVWLQWKFQYLIVWRSSVCIKTPKNGM